MRAQSGHGRSDAPPFVEILAGFDARRKSEPEGTTGHLELVNIVFVEKLVDILSIPVSVV